MSCLAPSLRVSSHWKKRTITYSARKSYRTHAEKNEEEPPSTFTLFTTRLHDKGIKRNKQEGTNKRKKGNKKFQRECVYLFSLISSAFKVLSENRIILVLHVFRKLHVFLLKSFQNWIFLFSGNLSSAARYPIVMINWQKELSGKTERFFSSAGSSF